MFVSFGGKTFKVIKTWYRKGVKHRSLRVFRGDQIDHSEGTYVPSKIRAIRTVECGQRKLSRKLSCLQRGRSPLTTLQPLGALYPNHPFEVAKRPQFLDQVSLVYAPSWCRQGTKLLIVNHHLVRTARYDRASAMGKSDPGPTFQQVVFGLEFLFAFIVIWNMLAGVDVVRDPTVYFRFKLCLLLAAVFREAFYVNRNWLHLDWNRVMHSLNGNIAWWVNYVAVLSGASLLCAPAVFSPLYFYVPVVTYSYNFVTCAMMGSALISNQGMHISWVMAGVLSICGTYVPTWLLSQAVINNIFWMVTFRFASSILAWIPAFLAYGFTPANARRCARACQMVTLIAGLAFIASCNFVTLYTYALIAVAFPVSYLIAFILITFPLFVIINYGFVIQVLSLFYAILTGDYALTFGLHGILRFWGVNFAHWVEWFGGFVETISGRRIFTSLNLLSFWAIERSLRLPLELYFSILAHNDPLPPGIRRLRWAKMRMFISLEIIFFNLYRLKFVLYYSLIVYGFIVGAGLFWTGVYFGRWAFVAALANVILTAISSFGISVMPLIKRCSRRFQVALADGYLLASAVVNPHIWRFSSGEFVLSFTQRDDGSSLHSEDLLNLLDSIYKPLTTNISLALFLVVLLAIRKLLFWLSHGLTKAFWVPLSSLTVIIWALTPWMIPDGAFDLMGLLLTNFYTVFSKDLPTFVQFSKQLLRFLGVFQIEGLYYLSSDNPKLDLPKGGADKFRFSKLYLVKTIRITRKAVLKGVERLNDFRLPEMISASYKPPSLQSIGRTYVDMEGLGFNTLPGFIDSLGDPADSQYLADWGSWKEKWRLGSTNFRLGFRKWALTSLPFFDGSIFFPDVVGDRHTSAFTGPEEELRSTARYWSGNDKNEEDQHFGDVLDGLWHGAKAQYQNSVLTPFSITFKGWEKKFNMGFGFGWFRNGKVMQWSRQHFIDKFGGPSKFLEVWAKVFRRSQTMDLPVPVFTKIETLKLSKQETRSVRTILGSPFVHHVMTTIFNYIPNHNYKIWDTPMKVGMPLNGQNFNKLWTSLISREEIFAGDMTAFDSTQSPPVVRLVAEMRKMGFEWHKDYDRICQLIDVSYEKLLNAPLGFKNFGEIGVKSQGFTTGHSSTSNDNSLALLVNYLYAWRMVTGLRCREFYNYNTLANFGDDHVLGFDRVFGWSPEKAMEAMAKLGTKMRDEAPGIRKMPSAKDKPVTGDWRTEKFSFLAKVPLPLSGEVANELKAAGITVPLNFATCHDPHRLIRKLKAQTTAKNAGDALRCYTVLLAYIDLTSHHPAIYSDCVRVAHGWHNRYADAWRKAGISPKRFPSPPSYNEVLRKWYSKEDVRYPHVEGLDEEDFSQDMILMTPPDRLGILIRWIADFPTMLSPRYTNSSWADWLQKALRVELSWPLAFVAQANAFSLDPSAAKLLLNRTPYSFLRSHLLVQSSDVPYGTLLFRHWLYNAFVGMWSRSRKFSFLDFIRYLDIQYINVAYLLTGKVSEVIVELDFHLIETLVVFALSYVNFDLGKYFPFLRPIYFDFQTPSFWFARFVSWLIRYVSPAGSIDYQPLDAAVDLLANDPESSFVLSAPTGVGKSTRMIVHICDRIRRKVVVITPRHLVAVGVGSYMMETWPNRRIGIQTEGFVARKDDAIIYTTVQSFFLNPWLREPGTVLIIDEAHIAEPAYDVIRQYCLDMPGQRYIMVSATPPSDLKIRTIEVPAVNQNTVHTINREVASPANYFDFVSMWVNDRLPTEKQLCFVTSLKQAYRLAEMVKVRVCIISSKHKKVDPDATLYISTNVCDAGITLPDVAFVHSMDHDIRVSSRMVDVSSKVEGGGYVSDKEVYYTPLSEATILQRKGRTGRTVDGVFFFYTVLGVPTEPQHYNILDYYHALSPGLEEAVMHFPPHLIPQLTDELFSSIPIFDAVPGFTWTGFNILSERYEAAYPEDPPGKNQGVDYFTWAKSLVKEYVQDAPRYGYASKIDPDEMPFDATDIKPPIYSGLEGPHEDVMEPISDQHKTQRELSKGKDLEDVELLTPSLDEDPPILMTKQNVSGEGLLCGAFAVQGLIQSHLGLYPSSDWVVYAIRSYILGDRTGHLDFFEFGLLRDFMYDYFRLRCTLIHNGTSIISPPVDMDDPEAIECTMYLDGIHYNYLGYPLSSDEGTRFMPPPKGGYL